MSGVNEDEYGQLRWKSLERYAFLHRRRLDLRHDFEKEEAELERKMQEVSSECRNVSLSEFMAMIRAEGAQSRSAAFRQALGWVKLDPKERVSEFDVAMKELDLFKLYEEDPELVTWAFDKGAQGDQTIHAGPYLSAFLRISQSLGSESGYSSSSLSPPRKNLFLSPAAVIRELLNTDAGNQFPCKFILVGNKRVDSTPMCQLVATIKEIGILFDFPDRYGVMQHIGVPDHMILINYVHSGSDFAYTYMQLLTAPKYASHVREVLQMDEDADGPCYYNPLSEDEDKKYLVLVFSENREEKAAVVKGLYKDILSVHSEAVAEVNMVRWSGEAFSGVPSEMEPACSTH